MSFSVQFIGLKSPPRLCAILLLLLSFSLKSTAQEDPLAQARMYVVQKDLAKARTAYETLYRQNPSNNDVYAELLDVLLAQKDFKTAEKLTGNQHSMAPQSPLPYVDLGRVYLADGKDKKADEQFSKAIQLLNGDDMLTQQLASAFSAINQDAYAIQTYERGRQILQNNFLYASPLSRLYAKTGDIDKAVNALLDAAPGQMNGVEDTKATLLEFLGSDAKKQQVATKAVIRRINQQPENPFLAEILTWLYTQKDDWEGALLQIQALDERNREGGRRLLEFSRLAQKEKQYDIAIKSLDAVTEGGKEVPFYSVARATKLEVLTERLREDPSFKPEDVTALEKDYEAFFIDFPQYYGTPAARDYATIEAQFAGKPQKAIEILQKVVSQPNVRGDMVGQAKLQMGDYQILLGKIWDASLLYSQVDKAFREDALGEEARFRNAKLAYYRGDFDWAQGQLSVLKASTSELIANDALYLSVLITENVAPDSNLVPLKRFAYADLLLFQNKDKEAQSLLDSLTNAFPKHPLQDDILLLQAKLDVKHRDYNAALAHLKTIIDKHGQDVLGDDAVFQSADLYERYLKQPEEARGLYEKLILDYPGSTYVQTARQRLQLLQESASKSIP